MDDTMHYVEGDWRRRLKSTLSNQLGRYGALPALFKMRELLAPLRPRVLWHNTRYRLRGSGDELPVPSSRMRFLVAGNCDIEWFLDGGRLGADTLRESLASCGHDLERMKSILDFGCGCGRVLRHLRGLSGKVFGVDLQHVLVDSCRRTVPFAEASVGPAEPPLTFADATFDLVYCFSVFTHLTEPQGLAWRDEIRRILEPGGLWVFSTQGIPYLQRLSHAEQDRFHTGRIVCQHGAYRGQNICQTYHPERYVREELARGFEVLAFVPQGARGNPVQDLYVLRRTPGS